MGLTASTLLVVDDSISKHTPSSEASTRSPSTADGSTGMLA
ncbi:hypothetical protein [Leucobacter coleopterorum]|nr:hypothetical protein [Leucobacter coleopterorum]